MRFLVLFALCMVFVVFSTTEAKTNPKLALRLKELLRDDSPTYCIQPGNWCPDPKEGNWCCQKCVKNGPKDFICEE
uniref:Venom peptide U6-SYTX-Sth1a n=1 Tax=Scytodes thoracica TaxID=1112478 RepID=A0A0A0V6C2_SCYTH|nr:venom peptide U6-SYTX-Sth1a [Scytodes thoracica]